MKELFKGLNAIRLLFIVVLVGTVGLSVISSYFSHTRFFRAVPSELSEEKERCFYKCYGRRPCKQESSRACLKIGNFFYKNKNKLFSSFFFEKGCEKNSVQS